MIESAREPRVQPKRTPKAVPIIKLTTAAVKTFQLKYKDEILSPWASHGLGADVATGYVYKTTLRWINLMKCSTLDLPMPQLP